MERRPIIAANWKSQPRSPAEVQALLGELTGIDGAVLSRAEVVLFPSAVHLGLVRQLVQGEILIGAQNISKDDDPVTGEVTAEMVKELGASWVLVGHSDRRHKPEFAETIEATVFKVERAQAAGLGVILCIGELEEERRADRTIEVCIKQLGPVLPKVRDWSKFVVAYEPVWAFGTGMVATKEHAQEAHEAVREFIKENCGDLAASTIRMQYGGSVTAANCAPLIGQSDVDGFLLGAASLKPKLFCSIAETTASR